MRRFPCASLAPLGAHVVLEASTSHHLLHVTRVPRGARVELFDGDGASVEAELLDVVDGQAVLRVCTDVRAAPVAAPLCLAAAVTKGSKYEDALRMAVELGVTEVIPVLSARCVARGDRRDRWLRVLEGAAGQSGRSTVPTLHPLLTFAEILGVGQGGMRWVCVPGAAGDIGTAAAATVLVGPEGGWTPDEVSAAKAAGWQAVGLGSTVLRAETAVAAALVRVRCQGPAR